MLTPSTTIYFFYWTDVKPIIKYTYPSLTHLNFPFWANTILSIMLNEEFFYKSL